MPLRKVLLSTTTVSNNAVSFVNQTARRLKIRKSIMGISSSEADSLGEANNASLDEVPVNQHRSNDSRSHIDYVKGNVGGGTGAIVMAPGRAVLSFGPNDLVLDPDEALFLNTQADIGSAIPRSTVNLFYED